MSITLIVLCAGNSTRFESKPKKQWLRIGNEPLWLNVTNRLKSYANFDKIIVVGHKNELNYMSNFTTEYEFVQGGNTRQDSMNNALQKVATKYVMVTDVARCCIPQEIIKELIDNKEEANCIVPYLKVSDTTLLNDELINRDDVKLIQTPQLSQTDILKEALKTDKLFTDDSGAIKAYGGSVKYIKGSIQSAKLTFLDDLQNINCLYLPSTDMFCGTGIDIHPFEENKQMVLGGVQIKCKYGFKAHSDGDVLIHSLIDALLGACGAGDIGEFFPDTDEQYKDANSQELLKYIVQFICNVGYEIVNVDLTIIAEIPKINPHKKAIKEQLAKLLNLPLYKVNIKATTAEKLGFIGRKEAVAVQSIAQLKYYNWDK